MTEIKLMSPKGEILGSLTAPTDCLAALHTRGFYQRVHMEPLPYPTWTRPGTAEIDMDPSVNAFHVFIEPSRDRPGFYWLRSPALEHIDRIRGFAFHPGVAYITALIAKSPIVKSDECQPSAT